MKTNIQDEITKIHAQYGTTEMANHKIQLLFDAEVDKAIKNNNDIWSKIRESTAKIREQCAIAFMLEYYVDEEHTEESEEEAIKDYYKRYRKSSLK